MYAIFVNNELYCTNEITCQIGNLTKEISSLEWYMCKMKNKQQLHLCNSC